MEISKADQLRYQQQMKEGMKIFQKSFKKASETKNFPEKKMLFNKATKEAMHSIEDAAKALMNQKITEQKNKLVKDYNNYIEHPNSTNQAKLEEDIKTFKKILD